MKVTEDHRLSTDAVLAVYDRGFIFDHASPLFMKPSEDDLKLLKENVQEVAPQKLYLYLKTLDDEELVEILPQISQEQFVRLLDYDAWRKDKLVPAQVFSWLKLYGDAGSEEVCQRFRNLDEEMQIAVLESYVKFYDKDAYETMPEEMQDSLYRFPGDAFFYSIETIDEGIREGVSALIDHFMSQDMNYAMLLLSHAAYMPPHESELLLSQFRRARLEEDGFVTSEEANAIFLPLNPDDLHKKWGHPEISPALVSVGTQEFFLKTVLEHATKNLGLSLETTRTSFYHLANAVAVATNCDPSDVPALKNILEILQNQISVSLELLSGQSVEKAWLILTSEVLKNLLRYSFGVFERIQANILSSLIHWPNFEKLQKAYNSRRYGQLLMWFDEEVLPQLGLIPAEMLKAIFNRFPLFAKTSEDGLRVQFESITSVAKLTEAMKAIHELSAELEKLQRKDLLS